MGIQRIGDAAKIVPELVITPEILKLIASLDEFKGRWLAFKRLSRDQLSQLKKIATIESIGYLHPH